MTRQQFTSAKTSLNQIPAIFKYMTSKGLNQYFNFDNGAGKFNKATEYLETFGTINIKYDPYNLPEEINKEAEQYKGLCVTSTIANVLNVIKEEQAQIDVLRKSSDMLCGAGICLISIYEGDKTGIGRQTKGDCWQNNKRTADYIETVKKVFSYVDIKHGFIIAWNE